MNPASDQTASPPAPDEQWAVVALGSNLGDSIQILESALQALQEWSTVPLRASSIWKTAPVDCPSGSPPFFNAVCALLPVRGETPESLLQKLLELEQQFGPRSRATRNEPRPLDLDLVLFGRQTRHSAALTLPHPRAARRKFVLGPLCEIAPGLVFPNEHQSVRALFERIAESQPAAPLRFSAGSDETLE